MVNLTFSLVKLSGNHLPYITTDLRSHRVAVNTSRVGQTPASICVMDLREAGSKGSGASYLFRELVETPSEVCVFTNLDDMVDFGYSDGSLAQYDLRQPETFLNFSNPHNGRITDLQLSDDRSANKGFIISSSADKTAQLHNARDLMELKKYNPVDQSIQQPFRQSEITLYWEVEKKPDQSLKRPHLRVNSKLSSIITAKTNEVQRRLNATYYTSRTVVHSRFTESHKNFK